MNQTRTHKSAQRAVPPVAERPARPRRYGLENRNLRAFAGQRRYAFVAGCGRSGTTALVRLLNRHPDLAIGNERYSYRAQGGTLSPELFETERFRDFRPGDTFYKNYDGNAEHEPMLHRYHAARVVGDKVPTLFYKLDQLDRFPGVRMIFILREPFAVAQSFVGRLRNRHNQHWPEGHDHRAGVREFNDAMVAIDRYVHSGKPALVLDYAALFLRKQGFDDIWRFLDVDPAKVGPTQDLFDHAEKMEATSQINAIGQEVAKYADFARYRDLLEFCPGGQKQPQD